MQADFTPLAGVLTASQDAYSVPEGCRIVARARRLDAALYVGTAGRLVIQCGGISAPLYSHALTAAYSSFVTGISIGVIDFRTAQRFIGALPDAFEFVR